MGQGACILAPSGLSLSSEEVAFFRRVDPWGFILFARNIDTPDQVRALTNHLREAVGRDAVVFIDQEGGRVQRMTPPHWRQWLPPFEEVARTGAEVLERRLALRYQIISAELLDVGIDGNCVPCADIATATTHSFLRNRCFGEDKETVIKAARAVVETCMTSGIMPTIKHIPGHGRSEDDSHTNLPRVKAAAELLEDIDFDVFKNLSFAPAGMTSHVVYEAFDDRPATQSPVIIDIIRNRIGFDGLLMTDDISMGALSGSIAERSTASLAAGCDLILHCNGNLSEMAVVADTSGRLQGASKTRSEAATTAHKKHRATPGDIDVAALVAAYEQI